MNIFMGILLLSGSLGFVESWQGRPLENKFLLPFLQALCVVALLTPIVQLIAKKTHILDHPATRKIHKKPVPLLGGIVLYIGFVTTVVCYCRKPIPHEIQSNLVLVQDLEFEIDIQ